MSLTGGSTTAKATRYYSHKDTVIATRSAAGLTWIIGDHHGTAEVSIAAKGLAVTKRRTLPFGDVRGGNPTTWPTTMDKGFVGGTKDPTGLTHLGARLYDPAIGRFISVDPVIDPKDPQQLNAYAYSNNNPVTKSDPKGEFFGALKKAASAVASAATTVANSATKLVTSTIESIKEDPLKFAVGVAVGIAATVAVGALCATGVGCLILAGAVAGAAAAGAEYGVDVGQGDREFSTGDLAKEMAIGGAVGGVTAGLGAGAGKVVAGARRTFGRGAKVADDIAEDAAEAGRHADDGAGGGGSCPVPWMSFDPRTPVLLANGATKPIGTIELGDQVTATDPISGVTKSEPVVALYSSQDILLADVTVVDADGTTGTIHTTQNHPFWNSGTERWIKAGDLRPGDEVGGAKVLSVFAFADSRQMLNLGIDELRTYYVVENGIPILVHNRPFDDVGSANNGRVTVYHYTTKAGYNGIKSGNPYVIRSGRAKHGKGPFVTPLGPKSLKPGDYKSKLGLTKVKSQFVIKFEIDKSKLGRIPGDRGQHVWTLPGDTQIDRKDASYLGPTEGCD